MVEYRRKQKQKLRKRSRRINKNNYSSIWNTNIKPYREYTQLPMDNQKFIYQYINTPENQRNDLNVQLAKMKNQDEIWYNIWHQQRNPSYQSSPEVQDIPKVQSLPEDKVAPSQPSESLYFNDFNIDKDMMDYQNNYYNQYGYFDYSQPFIGYSSIGSYMDINKLTPNNLYKLFEQYYKNK